MMLQSQISNVKRLGSDIQTEMFALYREHYDSTSRRRFLEDLCEKDSVILLRDSNGILRGFSTLMVSAAATPQGPARVLFSGDTVIDRAYWGTQALSFKWLHHAGKIKQAQPNLPLYWLLIVKGHRTYRYLPTFAVEFYPDWRKQTPDWALELIEMFATEKFGRFYRPDKGIVHFKRSRGHLTRDLAAVSPHEASRPDIAFFLQRNPGYVRGDELVCLCELKSSNLRTIARKHFDEGFNSP